MGTVHPLFLWPFSIAFCLFTIASPNLVNSTKDHWTPRCRESARSRPDPGRPGDEDPVENRGETMGK